jgi:hypothetical protein
MVASTASTAEISFSLPLAVYVVVALGASRPAGRSRGGAGGNLAIPESRPSRRSSAAPARRWRSASGSSS